MKKRIAVMVIACILLCMSTAEAMSIDYHIVIEDNGNSLVVMTLNGSGLAKIPIQQDVEDIKVKGALYIMENSSVDVSIGSTEKAVLLYQTALLTSKTDLWYFRMDLADMDKQVTVVMPKNTVVKSSNPLAKMDSEEFLKLYWDGNITDIAFDYYFSTEPMNDVFDNDDGNYYFLYIVVSVVGLVVLSSGIFAYTRIERKNRSLKSKQNIMKTLSANENKIITVLIENKGSIKRSKLEKITGISKSSLAASLKNLEKKNLLEVDRTYTSHYVRFTKWFNELQ